MSRRHTYLIIFGNGQRIVCGNNYKLWYEHAMDYRRYITRRLSKTIPMGIVNVLRSNTKFYDDGGLKWATPEAYQEVIDKLTVPGSGDHTRFEDIKFEQYEYGRKKIARLAHPELF